MLKVKYWPKCKVNLEGELFMSPWKCRSDFIIVLSRGLISDHANEDNPLGGSLSKERREWMGLN